MCVTESTMASCPSLSRHSKMLKMKARVSYTPSQRLWVSTNTLYYTLIVTAICHSFIPWLLRLSAWLLPSLDRHDLPWLRSCCPPCSVYPCHPHFFLFSFPLTSFTTPPSAELSYEPNQMNHHNQEEVQAFTNPVYPVITLHLPPLCVNSWPRYRAVRVFVLSTIPPEQDGLWWSELKNACAQNADLE